MKSLSEIVYIIEKLSIEKYGSINKMLKENEISKSAIDNMKKNPPSVPNIINFYKIAKALNVSIDSLLDEEEYDDGNLVVPTKSNVLDDVDFIDVSLSFDERGLIDSYRDLDGEGKYIIQDTIKRVWSQHCKTSAKDIPISGSSNNSKTS